MASAALHMRRPFKKMHGLGNDFVVFDARRTPLSMSAPRARGLADRHTGIGCDQLIVLRPSEQADVFMEIRNADGGEVAACGNASRCVARILLDDVDDGEAAPERVSIETRAGRLEAFAGEDGITVDMGAPILDWQRIPLAREQDVKALDFSVGGLSAPVALSMGNPHIVFFHDALDVIDPARLGAQAERDPLFPERTNVSFAQIEGAAIRLAVWERGAGLTRACGTAACAALVAAHLRGLVGRAAMAHLPGGALRVTWREDDDHVLLAGPAHTSFTGTVDLAAFPAGEEEAAA